LKYFPAVSSPQNAKLEDIEKLPGSIVAAEREQNTTITIKVRV